MTIQSLLDLYPRRRLRASRMARDLAQWRHVWSTPRTWNAGELVTSTMMNSHVRDNLNALPPTTLTITTTGTQTALATPVGRGDLVIFANNATLLTLQGLAAGFDGQQLTIFSIGAGQVDLAHQNGGATAANRIVTLTALTSSLTAGVGVAQLEYDVTASRWRQSSAQPSGGAAVATYPATLNNVISTNVITTFLSATLTNAISPGDLIKITFDALFKQNTGAGAVGTLTISLGGQTLAITLASWSDSATEWEEQIELTLQCVGANVKVRDYATIVNIANIAETLPFGDITGRAMNNVGTITGPTLTAGQSLLLRLTPSVSNASYYLKPQSASVVHYRN